MRWSRLDVACWLLKSAGRPAELPRHDAGPVTVRRCLRRSYRVGLMTLGQPCVLWISGRVDPGVGAVGRVAAEAEDGPEPGVLVELLALPRVVPRRDLVADPRFATAEVVRMAAGSNPSFLDAVQFTALLDHLGPDAPRGWPPRT